MTTGATGRSSPPVGTEAMRSTMSVPCVTRPTSAYSGGSPASAAVTTKNWLPDAPAGSGAERVAALDHERAGAAAGDAVEGEPVVEAARDEPGEGGRRLRRAADRQADRERPAVRAHRHRGRPL